MLLNHCVIDDFLAPDVVEALRDHTLSHRADFKPTKVRGGGVSADNPQVRQSEKCRAGLGGLAQPFQAAVERVTPDVFATLRIPQVQIADDRLELIAHRDGAFFLPHVDTFTGSNRHDEIGARLISLVYYFHLAREGFSGGELILHGVGGSPERRTIAPKDNRLVAFPSFAPHEVSRVTVPGNAFESARFAINCWLHRPRTG